MKVFHSGCKLPPGPLAPESVCTTRNSIALALLREKSKETRVLERRATERIEIVLVKHHAERRAEIGRVDALAELQRINAQRHLFVVLDAGAPQHVTIKIV
jgi:hypothetical protein